MGFPNLTHDNAPNRTTVDSGVEVLSLAARLPVAARAEVPAHMREGFYAALSAASCAPSQPAS